MDLRHQPPYRHRHRPRDLEMIPNVRHDRTAPHARPVREPHDRRHHRRHLPWFAQRVLLAMGTGQDHRELGDGRRGRRSLRREQQSCRGTRNPPEDVPDPGVRLFEHRHCHRGEDPWDTAPRPQPLPPTVVALVNHRHRTRPRTRAGRCTGRVLHRPTLATALPHRSGGRLRIRPHRCGPGTHDPHAPPRCPQLRRSHPARLGGDRLFLGFTVPTLIGSATVDRPPEPSATGSAVVNSGRQFGGVFGASILVVVLRKAEVTGDPGRVYELWGVAVALCAAAVFVSLGLTPNSNPPRPTSRFACHRRLAAPTVESLESAPTAHAWPKGHVHEAPSRCAFPIGRPRDYEHRRHQSSTEL